jgi:hypothetical protein
MRPANPIRGILGRVRFDEVLRTFAEFFEREGVRWAVIGGLAEGAYGNPRHDMKVAFVIDRAARVRVTTFVESLPLETPTTIAFVESDSPQLRDAQQNTIAGVTMQVVQRALVFERSNDADLIHYGPAALTFDKYLEALTFLTADRPAPCDITGPCEPFTL